MSLYTDIRDGVFAWTNKSFLVSETDFAIKKAIRTAHKAGKFWRDLGVVTVALSADTIQSIDISANLPNFRQIATLRSGTSDDIPPYRPVDVSDLFEEGMYYKQDVYWGIGSNINLRASSPPESVIVTYYKYPDLSNLEALDDWLANDHQDLISLWAAATILAIVNEQEIKTRVEALAQLAYADLISDSITVQGN
jgi:hypothetical protein